MEISGVEEWQQNALSFAVFPNPAKDKFKVQSLKFEVEDAMLEIFDLHGRKLLEKQITKGNETIEIDVSHLSSGVYFIQLQIEQTTTTGKLIIKK